ncbi:hypothetical protein DAMA08_037650 [Martiniozyma asiatica (nom. inval.)]|nr:hypothetical protein DAMA08_037650 [Martiniozyma asiatica]
MYQSLISTKSNALSDIPVTKEMFLDNYSKGKWNLSNIACPKCLQNLSFLTAPLAYEEMQRLKGVQKYLSLPQWDNPHKFNLVLRKMVNIFNCQGACVSLIDSQYQIVKYEIGFGHSKCSRQVSIDAHALLSSNFLCILDASKDWRFKGNPLVKGVPAIKYYLGVPLLDKHHQVIGMLSIFDQFPRQKLKEDNILIMRQIAAEIMIFLNSPLLECETVLKYKNLYNFTRNNENSGNKALHKNKTVDLLEIYGRATQTDSSSSTVIFEKDGSGNPYHSNSSLRLGKINSSYNNFNSKNWSLFLKCRDFKTASMELCKLIMKRLNLDCVYVINIQLSELFQIPKQLCPNIKEFPVKNYKFKNRLVPLGKEYIRIKPLSGYNSLGHFNNIKEKKFHTTAFKSSNGIVYQSKEPFVRFQSGFCLPFFKHQPKLSQIKSNITVGDDISLSMKSSGYMICCFSSKAMDMENEIGYVYGCASILRRLYFN